MSPANGPPVLSRMTLPIAAVADEVCHRLIDSNVVLQAEPGAGKSTGLPLALMQAGFAGKILLLEPRRLAARAVAARLASHLGESVGQRIGLRMRGSTHVSKNTRVEVVTEGVLTRILQNDPLLEAISVVVFDEFHERSLHADLGLALCLDVQNSVREDLRLLLMSATLDGHNLGKHINAGDPVVCKVRQHPVEISWRAEKYQSLAAAVAAATVSALNDHSGDALVFLPGIAEIEQTAKALQHRLPDGVQLHRLHSAISHEAQLAATAARPPSANGPRRVILSTSLAETSITIDGVAIVIDSGLERRQRVDRNSGAQKLETVMASRASATQRAGRAGRTQPGVCYRLWPETSHSTRAESWQPEILRAELSPLVCDLGQWGVNDPAMLPWIDPPPAVSMATATELLMRLGIWGEAGFTVYGRQVAVLPVHPRLGHMIRWAANQGCAKAACELAALVEDMPRQTGCDFSGLLKRLPGMHARRAQQLHEIVSKSGVSRDTTPGYAVLLAQAYPDRIALRRRSGNGRFLLSSGGGAAIDNDDALAHQQWLVVASLGGRASEARIFAALPITRSDLETWCSNLIESRELIDWDNQAARVIAENQRRIGKIVLQSETIRNLSDTQRQQALVGAIRKKGWQCLNWSEEVIDWQARVSRMRDLGEDYPQVSDEHLLATLEDWLQPFLGRSSTLQGLKQVNVQQALSSMLSYQQHQRLDQALPRRFTVPSGHSHSLRYACDGNPVLAVKLQEMFGCRENPAVAGGRIPLKVELLSPARRPVQITEDLANFLTNSYPAVKKDLAGRYPKHPWPDDPLSASPTARTKNSEHRRKTG